MDMDEIRYTRNTVENILNSLNSMTVVVIENCKRVAIIEALLQNPIQEVKKDGEENECG